MRKLWIAAGFAVGYVLGARAGRERYDQITGWVNQQMENEKVQQVTDAVKVQATQAANTATEKVRGTKIGDAVENFMASGEGHESDMSDELLDVRRGDAETEAQSSAVK
ncbi:hypothetical protein [Haloglycomyces albus]|uniref:hypothetical protein n=1 Tax=Haloglycomyces albus TaxID=526067 RepID=UPI00046D66E0|nr:hypothetical protein [Haloglycomyces albus]